MLDLLPTPSPTVTVGFAVLPVVASSMVVAGLARTAGSRPAGVAAAAFTAWLALSGALASAGFFDVWAPPRLVLVLATVLAVLVWTSRA